MTTATPRILRNNQKSKSTLFLLELVIAIMFLALSSVVCITLFVEAHTVSRKASDLNMAVIKAESAAEVFKAVKGDELRLAEFLNPSENGGGGYSIYYDAGWNTANDLQNAAYRLSCEITGDGALKTAVISVVNISDGGEIFSLKVKAHAGQEGAR